MKGFKEVISADRWDIPVRTLIRSGRLEEHSSESHWHEEMEVVYVRRGSGIQRIHQAVFALTPGMLAVICPNQVHSFIPMSQQEDFDILVLQFNLGEILADGGAGGQFCRDWLEGNLIFDRALPATPFLAELLEIIHRELETRESGSAFGIRGALYLLLTQLIRCDHGILPEHSTDIGEVRQRGRIEPAISYLTENYGREDLSVEQAAKAANLSLTHFSRLFKQATGVGFHEYLNRYRILQAEHLFSGSQSLLEIAYDCGFGSISAFQRNYRKFRGLSPQQARKQYTAKRPDSAS